MRVVIGRVGVVVGALAVACAAGCGKDCAPSSAGGTEIPANGEVTVSVVKYAALAEAVEKPKEKVVLVDFWATFCGPCVKKFPHFVALHEKYAEKGLVCVSVSLDDAEDLDKVKAFLFEKKAKFPNFVIRPTSAEDKLMAKKFNYDYTLPQMALFNRKGERVWDSNTDSLSKELPVFIEKLDTLVKAELDKK
jgi:thiol-disulfide isomerase/thioredoxin